MSSPGFVFYGYLDKDGQNAPTENGGFRIEISPDLSENYIPNSSSDVTPYVGKKFSQLEDGIQFYEDYATATGFKIRRGPKKISADGVVIWRYIYCSREGNKNVRTHNNATNNEDTKKRRRPSKRVSCMARLVFKYCPGEGYVVNEFIDRHTHNFVSDFHRKFMKANRKLDFAHKNFIMNCARANIGPMKSYRLFKEIVGGYSNVGCTRVDFKTYARDLRAYVNGVDAQLMLDKLFQKHEFCSAFTFDYCVDDNDKLTRLFWADPLARKNYFSFGEVVSFDATYSTNRYNLVFAPFTGKDNHGKCITFGAGLLTREDVESYAWLFEKFKMCMGTAPRMLITDQDPAIKIAVERALPETRHRLCMWHIMKKLPEKTPQRLKQDDSFRKKINDLVWSEVMEPITFEKEWDDMINEFDLMGPNWFTTMFEQRHSWIPAYFMDLPLSGLFKTTSISESVNNFYSKHSNPSSNLVQFFMHFESALDEQRYTHDQMNYNDESWFPKMDTPLLIVKYAATVYTKTIFLDVQKEIGCALYDCRIISIIVGEIGSIYKVADGDSCVFEVSYNKEDAFATCGCKHWVKVGLLCRHIFVVYNNLKIETIPEKNVVSRWTKYASMKTVQVVGSSMVAHCARSEDNKFLMNQLHSEFFESVGLADGNIDLMTSFLVGLRNLKQMLTQGNQSGEPNNQQLFDRFYGSPLPKEVSVLPPDLVKNKGSGSIIKSRKEKAIQRQNKPLRKCSKCHQMGHHDARNCPSNGPP